MAATRSERQRRARQVRRRAILEALAALARPLILERFGPSSCIASTAIGIDVLRRFGIGARPLPVRVEIYNPALAAALAAGNEPPTDPAARPAWMDAFGGWSIGLGMGGDEEPGKWPGHLVCWVDSPPVFVDLSLDQASRPARQIELGTAVFEPLPGFERGDQLAPFALPNGCLCRYQAVPAQQEFRRVPDWADRGRRSETVARIEAAIRARLAAAS